MADNPAEEGSTDSLTFGQLKKIVAQQRSKPKEAKIAFDYEDTEALAQELEDWYEYAQEDSLLRCQLIFEADYPGSQPWSMMSQDDRMIAIELYTSRLGHDDLETRRSSCACLSYIAQGCYGEIKSKEHQIRTILKNCGMISSTHSYLIIFAALRKSIEQLSRPETILSHDGDTLIQSISHLMTTLYFFLETQRRDQTAKFCSRAKEPSLIAYCIELTSKTTDDSEDRFRLISLRQIALLLWKSILYTLGGSTEVQKCKAYTCKVAGLKVVEDKLAIISSPLDYAVFRAELISKYPTYDPPPLIPDHIIDEPEAAKMRSTAVDLPILTNGQWTSTPAPSPPPSPKGKKSLYTTDQNMPFVLPPRESAAESVPLSIAEAAKLFQSRQRTTIPMMQLWQEQEIFVKNERGWSEDGATREPAKVFEASVEADTLAYVERLYAESLPHLQGCISGLVSLIWNITTHNLPTSSLQIDREVDAKIEESVANTRGWLFNEKPGTPTESNSTKSPLEIEDFREMEIALKTITAILRLLLKWFRASHVLKFEYLCQLIIDADWIHTLHQTLMATNPVVNVHETHESPGLSFFEVCATLSRQAQSSPAACAPLTRVQPKGARPRTISNVSVTSPITRFNWKIMFMTTNLLAITQKLVKKKIHRNSLLVQAKTWLHLRRPMKISHDGLQLYVLKLYKGQVPLLSRKWRMGNMRVITAIYMSCRPELREDWIAGTDVDTDLEDARSQESALRALTTFYNTRRYSESMVTMGFSMENESDEDDDFFSTELSRLNVM